MTKRLRFDAEAEAELEAAVAWYEEQRPGLGHELLRAVDEALGAIAASPASHGGFPHVPPDLALRRARVRRFPYSLPFIELGDEIRILAVAHDRRRPRFWLHRLAGR